MAIVRMKKLTAAVPEKDKRAVLRSLSKLGTVQLDSAEKTGLCERYDFLKKDAAGETPDKTAFTEALALLDRWAPAKGGLIKTQREVSEQAFFADLAPAREKAEEIVARGRRLEGLKRSVYETESLISSLEPWTKLDMPLQYGGTEKAACSLEKIPVSIAKVEAALGELPCVLDEVSRDGSNGYYTMICLRDDRDKVMAALRPLGVTEPDFSGLRGTAEDNVLEQRAVLERRRSELSACEESLRAAGEWRGDVETAIDAIAFIEEQESTLGRQARTESTVIVSGWVPESECEKCEKVLTKAGCGYELEDPGEGDDVPIKLKSGKFTQPFYEVVKMFGMPAYDSIFDPDPVISIFYLIFFGFMMADVGYGILITLGCFLGLKLLKPRGGMKSMLTLFMYCGIATAVAGVITGGYFSDAITAFSGAFLGKEITIPPLWFNPLEDPLTMLIFSIVLGIIHIMYAMALVSARRIKRGDVVGGITGSLSWYLIFAGVAALVLVKGSKLGMYLMIAGVAVMLIFGGWGEKGLKRFTGGFSALYGITGIFSDAMSYSRIMALGLSGAVMGQVFNRMGTMMKGPAGIVLFIIVFIIGHVFNLAISMLGAYVHTGRLQYVEFFGRFYEGGGRAFEPLKINTKYTDILKEDN